MPYELSLSRSSATNLRLMNGNRPIFVDDSAATFVFPREFVRFIEVPVAGLLANDYAARQRALRGRGL